MWSTDIKKIPPFSKTACVRICNHLQIPRFPTQLQRVTQKVKMSPSLIKIVCIRLYDYQSPVTNSRTGRVINWKLNWNSIPSCNTVCFIFISLFTRGSWYWGCGTVDWDSDPVLKYTYCPSFLLTDYVKSNVVNWYLWFPFSNPLFLLEQPGNWWQEHWLTGRILCWFWNWRSPQDA